MIIDSTKGMFYNCTDITEIDMSKFDTSSVTDMSEMFSMCSSLIYLNVSNLDTTNVESFEQMFYNCISLTSINLESFTNPSAVSLYRMFYGCENLEYINIKNFDEKENINVDEMFYNTPPNAVICSLSCPPPTNFIISSMSETDVHISWEGYEFNKFVISYDLQNLSNPEDGNKINVINKTHYIFTNLNSNERYDIYIKTECDRKSSYWIGPLLVSFEFYNMINYDSSTITTCSMVIYDSGGPNGNYENNAYSTLLIFPESPGKFLSIKGRIDTEIFHDNLTIYTGEIYSTIYSGYGTIPLFVSKAGYAFLQFESDSSTVFSGFNLFIDCIVISPRTIYNSIKDNNCRMISCDNNWRNIQNLIVEDTRECVKNCGDVTNNEYKYRGKCYNSCPENTMNINFECYSNNVLEKCEEYSIESEYENLCIKCKDNYYPKLNDKNNKYDFIDCYKMNSLDKYYLDNNDLLFKPCYESCKSCFQIGTKENHNCILCDSNYEFNLTSGEYYNCYPKCDNYYYFDNDKNFICLDEKKCPDDYINLIEEKNQCVHDCKLYQDFQFEFQNKCHNSCPVNISEISQEKEYYCEIICPKESPYELTKIQECVNDCTVSQMNNNLCRLNYKSNDKNEENEIQEKMVENIKEEMNNGIDTSEIDNGENIVIQEKDITLTITKTDSQKNEINSKTNTSSINLGKCEQKIKYLYNISKNDSLYILKMEIKQDGYKIPKLQYEAYYPLNNESKLSLLNLSVCEGINIDVYYSLALNGNLDIYNSNSNFYNDICTIFEENGKDLTLSERKKLYINNKLAICEENCYFLGYNKTTEKVKCSCKTKIYFEKKISENNFNEEGLYEIFTDFNNIMNIKVLECINLIFSLKSFKDNYANIILISIILLYFICLILFIFKGYNSEINFYIDIIIYFTLFRNKILYIIRKKEKEKMKTNLNSIKYNIKSTINLKENLHNKRNKFRKNKEFNKFRNLKTPNIIVIKPPIYNILLNSKHKLLTKDVISNPTKKKNGLLKITKRIQCKKNIFDKIKSEENTNQKFIKQSNIFNPFKNLSEDKIYELYVKLYTKTDNELNNLSYKDALRYDKRTYFSFYFSLIRCNHLLFFSFLPKFDFNSRIIKMYLFFFNFTTYFFVNALFFTDETISFGFNFIHNLPQIIYSSIISAVINELVKLLSLTEISFIDYRNKAKKEKKEKIIFQASNLKRNFKLKFAIFFILDLVLLGFFWIYLSCFSAVYNNTQMHLIKDTFISFGTSFISPIGIYLLPGIFRIPSLKNKNRKFLFIINQILQLI